MRRTMIITLSVLLCAMLVCTVNHVAVNRVVEHSLHLRTRALDAMDRADTTQTREEMVELAAYLKKNQSWLEMVCEHEDIHEVKSSIIDARAALEFDDRDDFYQAIYRFGESIEHIADIERVSLSNLY